MTGLKNTITSFLVLGVLIALFIGLITILIKVMAFGILIGAILYALFWIKNKIFGTSKKVKSFEDLKKGFGSYYYSSSSTNHTYSSKDRRNTGYTEPKQKNTGRIIDVKPEK